MIRVARWWGYSLAEHHRFVTIAQNTMLDVALNRPRQHQGLDIAAHLHQRLGRHGVIDSFDVLFDDRAFVQIFGDVMGRRADDLHAALMGLVIRPGPFETWQKTVMNIDRAALQRPTQTRRKNLHIARQHDQIDLLAFDQIDNGLFLRFAAGVIDRQMMERNAVGLG